MESTVQFEDALQASYEAIQLATGNDLMKSFRAKAFESFQAQGHSNQENLRSTNSRR